jgi:hypothetical protein
MLTEAAQRPLREESDPPLEMTVRELALGWQELQQKGALLQQSCT